MTNGEDLATDADGSQSHLRIGFTERVVARDALEIHRDGGRIDAGEFVHRWAAVQAARTQGELLRIFADLPDPHPELPGLSTPSTEPDEDPPPLAIAVFLLLFLGLPVGVVLGKVYGAWWTLTVPVLLSVAMVFVEHLRSRRPTAP